MHVNVIVLSGTMGAGKTTILGEASDILSERAVVHAAIDLDAVGVVGVPDDVGRRLTFQNLEAVFGNFIVAKVTRVLVATAVESPGDLEALRTAMFRPDLVLCRLLAAPDTLERRLRVREPGLHQEQFVVRSKQLDATLDGAGVEDFTVLNDGRGVTDVAEEVLRRAGWLS